MGNRLSVRICYNSQKGKLQVRAVFAEKPTQKEYDDGLTRRQFVFEFDEEMWKVGRVLPFFVFFFFQVLTGTTQRAIEVYNITECIVPARSKDTGATKITGKKGWYG